MINKIVFTLICSLLFIFRAHAQKWVDTVYAFQELKDIEYGQAVDFGGTIKSLKMNICVPKGDSVPPCGRPLMVIVHGGAFLAGDKNEGAPPLIMRDFAKRGYLTASVNYRLGFFQTSSQVNCNISSTGVPWNCLNASDSGEWERALYRGMQDVKGAIRYLVNQASTYKIDPRNVFLVGESAGGFVVLSAAFTDINSEKPAACGAAGTVAKPNKIYENQCVVGPGFSSSVDSLKLQRPDMGDIGGSLNLPSASYHIRGIGNFFGGMFTDLLSANPYQQAPVLYMFHQPNDLIVPYRKDLLFAQYAYCATQFPANCQYIINRKTVMGSRGIYDLANQLASKGKKVPKILFDSTLNASDCLGQISNPATAGHAIDNLPLRTKNMAVFFAQAIDTTKSCLVSGIYQTPRKYNAVKLYPNPAQHDLYIESEFDISGLEITDVTSKTVLRITSEQILDGHIDIGMLKTGMYLVKLSGVEGDVYRRISVE